MEKLAAAMGDSETEERSRITANHTEENFFKTFYDDGKGFLAFSADADDLKNATFIAFADISGTAIFMTSCSAKR